jgi:methyl-accepting chemotaxis protein
MMGDLPQGMGQAEQSMREAVDALHKPDFNGAADAQNQALKQMQQSMQSMKDMIQRQAGNSQGPGQRDKMDPFGRSNGEEESGGNIPDTQGPQIPKESELQRARQIFEELRQRQTDPNRPKDEREYLDRLLKQF